MPLRPEDFPVDRPEGARAFDFLFGRWRVHNRRLWRRLIGSNDWEEFGASLEVKPILGGLGNLDQYRTVIGDRYFESVSLRLFSLTTEEWRIYWADTKSGDLLPAVVGGFDGKVGTFLGEANHEGTIVKVRFLWHPIDDHSARWEQAYSADKGETWETNWVMEFERD